MNQTQKLKNRPSQVSIAVKLLWYSLGLGIVNTLTDPQSLDLVSQGSTAFTITIMAFTLVIMALLIWNISAGRNWARIIFLVVFLLGGLGYLFAAMNDPTDPSFNPFARSMLAGLISLLQLAFQLVALRFIFTKPGASWFKKGQPAAERTALDL